MVFFVTVVKMDKEQLYEEHLDEMFGLTQLDELADKDVDRILERVLRLLPNDGKLYKYRSIEGTPFEYAYDGLKNGYLYMARANTLNDDMDSTLNFNVEKDVNKQIKLFMEKPWLYLDAWINANLDRSIFQSSIDKTAYQMVISCINPITYEIDNDKAIDLFGSIGISRDYVEKFINDILELVKNEIEKHSDILKEALSKIVNFNTESKKDIYVFSMTEDYDSDTMWAYYANSNKGFCIEYDYNKIKNLSFDTKRVLISIYKVIYMERFEEHSFVDMIRFFMGGKKDIELFKKANRELLEHTITKLSKWKEEKEWRLFLCNLDENNKIFADIVSGVILDERAIKCENGQVLIKLAKERGWNIRVRKRTPSGIGHYFEALVE